MCNERAVQSRGLANGGGDGWQGYDVYEEQTLFLLLDLGVFKWYVLFIFLLLICVNSKRKYISYEVSHLTFQTRMNSLTWHLW